MRNNDFTCLEGRRDDCGDPKKHFSIFPKFSFPKPATRYIRGPLSNSGPLFIAFRLSVFLFRSPSPFLSPPLFAHAARWRARVTSVLLSFTLSTCVFSSPTGHFLCTATFFLLLLSLPLSACVFPFSGHF